MITIFFFSFSTHHQKSLEIEIFWIKITTNNSLSRIQVVSQVIFFLKSWALAISFSWNAAESFSCTFNSLCVLWKKKELRIGTEQLSLTFISLHFKFIDFSFFSPRMVYAVRWVYKMRWFFPIFSLSRSLRSRLHSVVDASGSDDDDNRDVISLHIISLLTQPLHYSISIVTISINCEKLNSFNNPVFGRLSTQLIHITSLTWSWKKFNRKIFIIIIIYFL